MIVTNTTTSFESLPDGVADAPSEDWLIVTQTDHAHLAANLLKVLAGPGEREKAFQLDRFEALLFAARHHDNGWQELDSAPLLHPERDRPHDFLSLPKEHREVVWSRGTERFLYDYPLAALLIHFHAARLLRHSTGTSKTLLKTLDQRNEELRTGLDLDVATVERLYVWLEVVDLISLVACNRWTNVTERAGLLMQYEAKDPHQGSLRTSQAPLREPDQPNLTLDPGFAPPKAPVELSYRARTLPRRTYRNGSDLAVQLARAPWQDFSLTFSFDQTVV